MITLENIQPLNSSLPSLRQVIEQHGLLAKKSLGQHFLLDRGVTQRIARAAGTFKDVTVIEIGPGPGGLTRALLEQGAKVVAIERDHRCLDILTDIQAAFPRQLQIIEGDALTYSPQVVVPAGPIKIVANLPYNIGTLLLTNWLAELDRLTSLTLMFQKEVALRLIAKPRTKDYGRLSIFIQWLCQTQRLFDLSPKCFMPAPKVTSSVVHLIPKHREASETVLLPTLSLLTRHAFGQRRKMIRSSLKPLFTEERLRELGLNPCARAEELTINDYIALARSLKV